MDTTDIIVIGEGRHLSRRKARKLAYCYRGSRRGRRYVSFLAGTQSDFYAQNNRLHRLPKAGRITTITVHSAGVRQSIRKAVAGLAAYSIKSPPEVTIRR